MMIMEKKKYMKVGLIICILIGRQTTIQWYFKVGETHQMTEIVISNKSSQVSI